MNSDTELFPHGSFRPVLRLYIPYWNEESVRRETVRYCRETGIRDILLFSDAQYLVWNQLSPQELEREYGVWSRSIRAFREAGIQTIGINCSLMQMQSKADHRRHSDYDYWLTSADGSCLHNLPCPMDPKLDAYIDLFFGKLAAAGADYLYMDDDLRYMNNTVGNSLGCFCPLHLKRFSGLTGKEWTADTLREAVLNDPELRRTWVRFNGARLEDIAVRIGQAAKRVNPAVRLGLMVPCVSGIPLSGNDLVKTAENIAAGSRTLLRPCIGPYQDYNRKMVFAGLYHLEMTRKIFGSSADYTPEIETSPSTAVSKSGTVARLYMMQGLLNRMNAPLFTTVGYCGDTPYLEPRYLRMLKDSAPFFRSVLRHAPEPSARRGIGLFSNLNAPMQYQAPVKNITRLYFPACVLHDVLDSAGLPHTYEKSPVSFLCGIHAAALSRQEAEEVLRGGVFLDALAAEILIGKGLGSLIGTGAGIPLPYAAAEKCVMTEVFGSYTGSYMQSRIAPQGSIRRFVPEPGAEEVSAFMDHDLNYLYPAVIRFRNRLGGRIAVLPYEIQETADTTAVYHLICHQRQRMFHALTDWMDPALLPCRLPDGSETVMQYWREKERSVLVLTNIAYDVYDSCELKSSLPLDHAQCIADDGSVRPLKWSDGVLHERLEPFHPLMILIPSMDSERG